MREQKYRTPDAEAAYDKYGDMLFRLAYARLFSKEDAEDAVADVFSKFLRNPPVFRDAEHEKAWIVRVLINQCCDLQRRRSVRSYTPLDQVTEHPAVGDGDSGVLEEVLRLQEPYKPAVILYYFEDFTVEEIAKSMRVSVSAVKMRLSRGREQLKHALQEER